MFEIVVPISGCREYVKSIPQTPEDEKYIAGRVAESLPEILSSEIALIDESDGREFLVTEPQAHERESGQLHLCRPKT